MSGVNSLISAAPTSSGSWRGRINTRALETKRAGRKRPRPSHPAHCVWQDLNVSGFSKESKDAREKRAERPKPPTLRAPEAPRRPPAPPPRPRLTQNACYEQPPVPARCHGNPSPSATIRARLVHCSDPAGWNREPRSQVPGSTPPTPPARAQVQPREEGLGLSVGGGWTGGGQGFPARQPPLVQLGSTIPPVSQPRSCWRLRRVGMWDCTERGGILPARVHYSDMVRIYNQVIRDKDPGESRGIQVKATLCSLPSLRGHLELPLPPALKMQQHVWDVSVQESPLKTQHPRVLQGLVAGTLCLAFTKILDLQRESRQLFSTNRIFLHSLDTVRYSCPL